MAQNKQKEVESQSLQAFEKFIGKLDGIISGDSLYSQSVSEREIAIADVIKNGKEVIQQLKSEVRRELGPPVSICAWILRWICGRPVILSLDFSLLGSGVRKWSVQPWSFLRRRSGEQQVMHTPEQRRMEDKNIQGRRSGEQQVMHTPEQRRMEDKNIQGRRSGKQQVMHTPEQRRMEDKNIQGRSGEQQVMHTPEQRRMEDKNIQGRSGKQQVMHTPEQRRMEDKNIQGPSTDEKKSDEEARQVSLLQDELRKCRNDLKTKDREIESLIKRVAGFNEMQTKRDQRNVEDTLSLNRPSLVERDFWQLKTEERVDALEVLRKRYENEIDVFPEILTCIIFEAIYEHMLETRSLMVEGCKEITKMAVKDGPWLGRHFLTRKDRREEASVNLLIKLHSRGSDCPRQVMDSLLLAIKESASELDVDEFTKDPFLKQIDVKCEHVSGKRLLRKIPWEELLLDLADYVKKLVKLTWRMVTQLPPLRLEYHKTTFNSQYHIMAGSDHKDKVGKDHEKPVCYLWPGLLDGGGRVIRVGEVTVRQSS
ncbi:uncharacterized protein [Pocillopora verrucosa]|uniref:uncharacterized protein isoform X8 n=1 Tax=Pocillopora verrucosa TaxID=203993 RepID=UPI0033410054